MAQKTNKFVNVFNVILMILLITTGGGVAFNVWPSLFFAIFGLLLIGAFVFNVEKVSFRDSVLFMTGMVVITLFLSVNYAVAQYANDIAVYLNTIIKFAVVALLLLYYRAGNFDFIGDLMIALKVVIAQALLSFILSFFLADYMVAIDTGTYITNTFYYIIYSQLGPLKFYGLDLYRNQGIFWEPGVLQVYMNIAFFLSTFVRRDKRMQILSSIVILTTYSTTGVGLLFLQTLVFFRESCSFSMKYILFACLILTVIGFILKTNVGEKVYGETPTSSLSRYYDFMESVDLSIKHKYTGIGLDQNAYISAQSNNYTSELLQGEEWFDRGNSNSLMMLFVSLGIPLSFLFLYFVLRQNIVCVKKALFMSIIFISLISEPLLMTPFFFIFFMSGFMRSLLGDDKNWRYMCR